MGSLVLFDDNGWPGSSSHDSYSVCTFPEVVTSDNIWIELILVKFSHHRGSWKADVTLTRQEKFMLKGKHVWVLIGCKWPHK